MEKIIVGRWRSKCKGPEAVVACVFEEQQEDKYGWSRGSELGGQLREECLGKGDVRCKGPEAGESGLVEGAPGSLWGWRGAGGTEVSAAQPCRPR